MKVAYVINQYPQISQSFIRREIAAVEAAEVQVERFTLRRSSDRLLDQRDLAEQRRTRVVLDSGPLGLIRAMLRVSLTRPGAFCAAAGAAFRCGRASHRGLLRHAAYLAEACVLLRWLNRRGIQHVHAHFGTNSTMVPMLCRLLGGPPYSFTAHGPEEFDRPEALALEEKIHHAAFVVAISDFGRSQLYRWCAAADWGKIHVVHCGVDELFLSAPITPLPPEPRLICVGRLAEQKGQLLLLEAAARLAHWNVAFELLLVGDGPMRSDIQQRITELGLQRQVRLAGWMNNHQVRQAIERSRALVLSSFAEGLPVVIMEAMALHRPVVSTSVAGIPELVEPQVNGWLVPPGSVDALAEAMRQILEADPERLAEMGRAGAARVAQQHHAACEGIKLAELFRTYAGRAQDSVQQRNRRPSVSTSDAPCSFPSPGTPGEREKTALAEKHL